MNSRCSRSGGWQILSSRCQTLHSPPTKMSGFYSTIRGVAATGRSLSLPPSGCSVDPAVRRHLGDLMKAALLNRPLSSCFPRCCCFPAASPGVFRPEARCLRTAFLTALGATQGQKALPDFEASWGIDPASTPISVTRSTKLVRQTSEDLFITADASIRLPTIETRTWNVGLALVVDHGRRHPSLRAV